MWRIAREAFSPNIPPVIEQEHLSAKDAKRARTSVASGNLVGPAPLICWLRFPLRPLRPLRTKKQSASFGKTDQRPDKSGPANSEASAIAREMG
jgi:hypothetical protein